MSVKANEIHEPEDFGFGLGDGENPLLRIFIITFYLLSLVAGVAVSLVPFLV